MQLSTLGVAASALQAQQTRLDLVGHNLANLQTAGFRAIRPELVDLPSDPGTYGTLAPVRLTRADNLSRGVTVVRLTQSDLPGPIISTGSSLDVALPDGVYLAVRLANGQTVYTRDGHIQLNAQGRFEVAGQPLQGNLALRPNEGTPVIDDQGRVVAAGPGGTRTLGTLPLVRFQNPEELDPMGLTLLRATPNSGPARPYTPRAGEAIVPGALEGSNVQVGAEFTNLIRAQRAYQASTELIRTWDSLAGQTIQEIGRP